MSFLGLVEEAGTKVQDGMVACLVACYRALWRNTDINWDRMA